MDETLRQLGGLLLGSVPTIIFMVLVFGLYTSLVHKPLVRVLTERHAKTQGAVEKARADIAAAQARTADYEQRIREARLGIFKAQEGRRQQALQARATAVAAARGRANEQIAAARQAIEKEKQTALAGLKGEVNSLASEIVRTVLRPAIAQSQVGGSR
jgi:F-type H+-transporting ATPase subunit b